MPRVGGLAGASPIWLSAAPGTIERPRLDDASLEQGDYGWIVTVYDNDTNTYEEVMAILMIATSCDEAEAFIEAWEIDHLGRSVVHHGSEEACLKAARIIATIGIGVEATQE